MQLLTLVLLLLCLYMASSGKQGEPCTDEWMAEQTETCEVAIVCTAADDGTLTWVPFTCPDGWKPNAYGSECEEGVCGPSSATQATVAPSAPEFKCEDHMPPGVLDGPVPDPSDCHKFYDCFYVPELKVWDKLHTKCNRGQYYNRETNFGRCDIGECPY